MQSILRTDEQRAAFVGQIHRMPLPLEIECVPYEESRTLHQNRWYWWDLKIIAEQAVINNRQYSKEVWHEYYKGRFLPIVNEIIIRGRAVLIYKSTTDLSKKEMYDYRYQVESDAIQELGIRFPDYHQETG